MLSCSSSISSINLASSLLDILLLFPSQSVIILLSLLPSLLLLFLSSFRVLGKVPYILLLGDGGLVLLICGPSQHHPISGNGGSVVHHSSYPWALIFFIRQPC